jgi:hypothetical protein
MKEGKKDKITQLRPGMVYNSQVNTTDVAMNNKLLLTLQLSGLGGMERRIILGMLNLVHKLMPYRVTPEMQNMLGKVIPKIGREVLQENIQIEKQLSPIGFKKINIWLVMMLVGTNIVPEDDMTPFMDAR